MKKAKIKDLHLTQMTHREREVAKEADKYRSLEGHDLDMAIAEKPVPIVLGPGGQPIHNRPPRRSRTRFSDAAGRTSSGKTPLNSEHPIATLQSLVYRDMEVPVGHLRG